MTCHPAQVADFEWPSKRAPDLEKLVDLCRSLDSWLRADEKNVVVLHCNVSWCFSVIKGVDRD